MLTSSEKMLLEWLQKDDGQYGECHGKTLDGLIERGLVVVQGAESGMVNGFIAKGADIMFRAVSITDAGRQALAPKRWEVRTRVTLMRYYVEAEDRKSAEAASCEASSDHEEEENEETMEITEIVEDTSTPSPAKLGVPHDK
jgi:signal transduction histidine kinase